MVYYFNRKNFKIPIDRIDEDWVYVMKVFFLCSGFLNALTRLSEPFFYTNLYMGIKNGLFSAFGN